MPGQIPVGTISVASDFQYAGMYEHANSLLNLTKYRAYDPVSGRWISRDPLQEAPGLNLYSYVGNNPINYNDQNGENLVVLIVIGLVVTLALFAITIHELGQNASPLNQSGNDNQKTFDQAAQDMKNNNPNALDNLHNNQQQANKDTPAAQNALDNMAQTCVDNATISLVPDIPEMKGMSEATKEAAQITKEVSADAITRTLDATPSTTPAPPAPPIQPLVTPPTLRPPDDNP